MSSLPRSYPAPIDVIDVKLGEIRDIVDRLIRSDERFRTREIELRREALDLGEQLVTAQKEIAQRDQIIEELRALRGEKS